MNQINVFAVPSHQTKDRTSGVDFARVIQPMKYLNGYTYGDYTFHVDMYDIHAEKDDQMSWVDIAKMYDIVYLNYTVLDWQYAAMGSCVHGEKKKIIMDIDDAIWFVQPDNITHNALKELNADYILSCILDDVDGIITTNQYLKNVIVDKTYRKHSDIKVIPNHIDLSKYTHAKNYSNSDEITLLHYGSTSHFDDLLDEDFLKGIDRIFESYPQVKIKTVGSFIADLKYRWSSRYSNDFGDVDIHKWIETKFPQFMDEADIMVVPLRDTKYNRCKSDIKFIETASASIPGIFSSTRPYLETIEQGKTGFLAKTSDEWFESIKKLVEDKDLRKTIGKQANDYVVANRKIQDHVKEYAEYFIKVLTG